MTDSSWRFVADNPGVDCWTAWSGVEHTFLLIPVEPGRVYGYAARTRGGDIGADRSSLVQAASGFPAVLRNTVARALDTGELHHASVDEVRLTRWHHGRLVLIGDAAHATGPVWAQGVAMALEDAIVLGGLLACTPTDGWASVGAEFERLRRPTVEHVQAATDQMSRLAAMPGILRDLVRARARASQLSAGLRPAARPLTSCQRALTRSSHSRPAQAFPRERLGPETGMHRIPQSRERSITDAASRTISATFSAGVRTTTSRAEMLIGRADMLIGRISDRGGAAGGPTRGRRFRPTPRGRRRPGHRRARRPLDPVAPRPRGRHLRGCRPARAALCTDRGTKHVVDHGPRGLTGNHLAAEGWPFKTGTNASALPPRGRSLWDAAGLWSASRHLG